jgi:hypothetical protein
MTALNETQQCQLRMLYQKYKIPVVGNSLMIQKKFKSSKTDTYVQHSLNFDFSQPEKLQNSHIFFR